MMMGLILVALAQEGAPSSFMTATEQSASLDVPFRIEMISQSLLGLPYVLDAEGEGEGYDPDPQQNFKGMDCLTYVEAVLAFSMSRNWDDALDIRNDIRYFDQDVHYENRKHFMFSQWIPSNITHGYIQNISSQVGRTTYFSRTFDEQLWKNWSGKKTIPLPLDDFPKGDVLIHTGDASNFGTSGELKDFAIWFANVPRIQTSTHFTKKGSILTQRLAEL